MKYIYVIIAIIVLLIAVYCLFVYTPLGMYLIVFQQNPGTFNRDLYMSVVDQARKLNIDKGQEVLLRIDNLSDPKSLRHLRTGESFKRGEWAGCVWAELSKDNKLKVVIETRDMGHAGEYGYAYSDEPLIAKKLLGSNWFKLDLPGRLKLVQLDMKIDDHWWSVLYNLD